MDLLTTVLGRDSATCKVVRPVCRILVVFIDIVCGDLLSRAEDDALLDPSHDMELVLVIDVSSVPCAEPFPVE